RGSLPAAAEWISSTLVRLLARPELEVVASDVVVGLEDPVGVVLDVRLDDHAGEGLVDVLPAAVRLEHTLQLPEGLVDLTEDVRLEVDPEAGRLLAVRDLLVVRRERRLAEAAVVLDPDEVGGSRETDLVLVER